MKFRSVLKKREEVAEGTTAFYFEKPPGFEFVAGQHVVMTHINPPETDAEGDRRVLCIASAPSEKDLIFAMRMRDTAFKRVLATMPIGTAVEIDGPYGEFILHSDLSRQAVFLAGGIGITPFRSMILDAAGNNLSHRIFLFYSNYRRKGSAFFEELRDMQEENSNYTFIATMTDVKKSNRAWEGETGYINKEMLRKHLGSLLEPVYYIAGPPGFVLAMRGLLQEEGVDSADVKFDQFVGY